MNTCDHTSITVKSSGHIYKVQSKIFFYRSTKQKLKLEVFGSSN